MLYLCRKQVVNRLKIPQGLSTLVFRWWSEVPPRGGSAVVHRKKNDLLPKEITCYICQKQVVNRLKIPQGLSTLLFRRWSEVPSRGGVRGDSP